MKNGLVEISLRGGAYPMRPCYGAIRDIEARSGMTVSELLELVVAQRVKLQEAALIVWHGTEAANADLSSLDVVGDCLFEARLTAPHIRRALAQFLALCLWAPDEAKKKFDGEIAPLLDPAATG